jgi:hypothetical protein
MRRWCLLVLLLPLGGCAFFDDCVAFSEAEWHKFVDDAPAGSPGQVRACGEGPVAPAGGRLPVQTAEPPR